MKTKKIGLTGSLSWREVRVLRVQVVRALLYNVYISAYLRIIPQAQMGSVLTQRPRGQEEYYCFSKIQLVGQNKTTLARKTRFSHHCFGFQSQCFSLIVGYNIIA